MDGLLDRYRKKSVFVRDLARVLKEDNATDIPTEASFQFYVDHKEIREEVIREEVILHNIGYSGT